ncbi:hypothetical protein CEXT_179111 [Caerostris extrusa]|uniref:Uncharacterized protein n=1 Tax=Caerostris extrusa TaxID=172846 RepID=A0AAV4RXG3_CAEEX|nr:hypothetical protein CEXT_179111 [Caerostris extrusa]
MQTCCEIFYWLFLSRKVFYFLGNIYFVNEACLANSWRLRSCLASEGQDEPRQGQHRPPEGQSVTPLSSLGPHLRRRGPADLPGIPFATSVRKEALHIPVGLSLALILWRPLSFLS